jgi:hypothetical protein
MRASTKSILGAVLAMFAALLPALALFGFMVDDALITARVAHHLANGRGYRFNPEGSVVDAVTPLGFAHLLSPFASSSPLAAFEAARYIGLGAWVAAAGVLGALAARQGPRALFVATVVLGVDVPLAAWAGSGMETALVTALATLGLVQVRAAPLALGLAAGWRPELLPWAVTLAAARAVFDRPARSATARRAIVLAIALALAPFIVVAVLRSTIFGQALPLSAVAKPADTVLGLRYALGGLVFCGPGWLLIGWRAYYKTSPLTRASVLAFAAHLFALVQAGGDWMPFYRLFVPVLPSLVLAGAELAERSSKLRVALRLVPVLGGAWLLGSTHGRSASQVWTHRAAVIDAARPVLAGARSVAALDVGWVGAATAANIVDLAGVTDPSIARLRGSHTTKRLPEGLLEVRAVDAVVLFVEGSDTKSFPDLAYVHPVDVRLSRLLSFEEFRPVASIPLGGTTRSYVIARRALAR